MNERGSTGPTDRAGVEVEEVDARTVVLAIRGEAATLDSDFLFREITGTTAERVVLDLVEARHIETGAADSLVRSAQTLASEDRRLVIASEDPDLRQALGLAAGEIIDLAAGREEALQRLDL
ncbi:MAG: STAS domain-containing protein [Solirubrobacteraceae bacterium]